MFVITLAFCYQEGLRPVCAALRGTCQTACPAAWCARQNASDSANIPHTIDAHVSECICFDVNVMYDVTAFSTRM